MNCQLEHAVNITDGSSVNHQPSFMLFDLMTGGHHAFYIKHIVHHWMAIERQENLYILVAPEFFSKHADVVESAVASENIYFVAVSPTEMATISNRQNLLKSMFQEWKIYCQYARKFQITHALLMYYDLFQMPIALGGKSPCDFSGIYFRPTFHYPTFDNYQFSLSDYVRQLRQKLLLGLVLRNPRLKTLFSLDPFAVKHMKRLRGRARVAHLPDPMELHQVEQSEIVRVQQSLAIEPDRQIFLLFGSLHERKGVQQVLDAMCLLPPEPAKKVCLVFVGKITSSNPDAILHQIAMIRQTTAVQIVVRDHFVPDQDVQTYFQLADFILAPYQRHVGMSGIVLQAAAARKPVLASDYGLIGQIVSDNNLGYLVDSSSPSAIAQLMTQCVSQLDARPYDFESSAMLIQQHDAKEFAVNLVDRMLASK
ncbi:glycosyltransferase [filamentous cyanobacterium LEGE 11480]|uniref:Glycosyltransferase n=1 Tax=Romeriopsis navalis LEGE 11480 TaxID=2777977 RepID=A0A928VIF0_9CYAN|nr:glycosyltransferase [Romeriopsis navalis]MBE9028905.1 glycosyltransferase [Romeriopsis navalis LEGE 11480]